MILYENDEIKIRSLDVHLITDILYELIWPGNVNVFWENQYMATLQKRKYKYF